MWGGGQEEEEERDSREDKGKEKRAELTGLLGTSLET